MDIEKFLDDLEKLVNIDCGSNVPKGLREVTDFFKERLKENWIIKEYPENNGKNPVLLLKNNNSEKIDLLFLGHNDTVFPKGTTKDWKYRLEKDIVTGPGCCDMKAGVLSMVEIAEEFRKENINIAMIMNTDEEIGSKFSKSIIEEVGKNTKYAMVFEPARKNGNNVIERKGIIKYKVEFFGKASHAGNAPQEGINSILEAAHWITEISKLHNWEIKNSINVGIIEGGVGVNIVPDYAAIEFEGRSHNLEFFNEIEDKIKELEKNPVVKGIKINIERGGFRAPLVLNEKSELLKNIFDESKKELNIQCDWEIAGGCSDGNFLGVLGVGVIDGLGPIGGEAHSKREYLEVSSIKERIELVKKVIRKMIERKMFD